MKTKKRNSPRGFTMMEMLVTIALVVMIITGVGILTQHMGKLVSTSQASNELLSNVRAAQSIIENDLMNLDRNGFLIIRGRANTYDPTKKERYDQLGLMAAGSYPNRTGNDNSGSGANPAVFLMADNSYASGAIVWYGQCVIERPGGGTTPSGTNFTTPGASAGTSLSALPSMINEQDGILGRRAMLLMSPAGTNANRITYAPPGLPASMNNAATPATYGLRIPCFDTPEWQPANKGLIVASTISGIATETSGCHVTSSRVAVAAQTNDMVMRSINNGGVSQISGGPSPTTTSYASVAQKIAYTYCYRIRVLQDIYGNNDGNYATNYFRMHPQLLQGCSSFGVDWTDGSYDGSGNLTWYGSGNPAPASYNSAQPSAINSDDYVAVFSTQNRDQWPKAIRITLRVTDRNLRLNGPRDFVHVVRIGG